MAILTIKDLSASKALDGKAMAAVAGGIREAALPLLLLDVTSVSTSFPVHNRSLQGSAQANAVGPFNFGVVDQHNSSAQESIQLGNLLLA